MTMRGRWVRGPGLGPLAAALVIGVTPTWAAAVDCYGTGNRALDAGQLADAVAAFGAAAELPDCASSRAGLLYNKAAALHRLVDAGGDRVLACEAAATYRAVMGLDPGGKVGQASAAAVEAVEAECAPAADTTPAPERADPPPPAVDHTVEWGLTGGAVAGLVTGGVLLLLAQSAAEDRDAADARQLAAAAGSDEEAAALADFYDASDRTDALGVSGYVVGGVGAALAVAAIVAWVVEDEAAGVTVAPAFGLHGVGGVSVGGVW